MPKRQVFYSFHYENDARRVSQIRNIGVLEGNTPVSANQWENVKNNGEPAIKHWIDESMKNRSVVIVFIGEQTAKRKWIRYEIIKAWKDKRALLGIHIHNIKDPQIGKGRRGANPFDTIHFNNGTLLSKYVKCYEPDPQDAYNDIAENIDFWIEEALKSEHCK